MIDPKAPNFTFLPSKRFDAMRFPFSGDIRDPVVSVLTPCFNTKADIHHVYRSLQGQSLQNWEWVVVDDGSADAATIAALSTLAKTESRMRLITQENTGPAIARNIAFAQSRGQYVCLLDSDDQIDPTYLEKTVWFLESNANFAFCNSWSVFFGDEEFLFRKGLNRGAKFLDVNIGPLISVIRREAFAQSGGFDETLHEGHEDWVLWLKMADQGYWGYTIPEYLQWYQKRHDGRYEQFVRQPGKHRQFTRMIRKRFGHLRRNFPQPALQLPRPFDPINTEPTIDPKLARQRNGKRILLMIPWMVTGGTDQMNLQMIEILIAKGYDVTICATMQGVHEWLHRFANLTPDIFILPHFLRPADYPRFLSYIMASRKIDIVLNVHCLLGYLLLPYLRCQAPGTIFIDLCHIEEMGWYHGGHPRFSLGYQDLLDLTIVSTAHLRDWMIARGAEAERIRVLYAGVKPVSAEEKANNRAHVRNEMNIPEDGTIIIYAGRLEPQKNPQLLANIVARLAESGERVDFFVIGDGPEKKRLKKAIGRHGLGSRTHFFGTVSHEKWLRLLDAADVFLLTSHNEGIAIAALEAMAHAIVPVVPGVGGHKEAVLPGMGYVIDRQIDKDDARQFAGAIRQLLDQPQKRLEMGRCAQVHVKEAFSLRQFDQSIGDIFEHAGKLSKNRPRTDIPPRLAMELATYAMEYARANRRLYGSYRSVIKPGILDQATSLVKKTFHVLRRFR